jgi:hypothetical protein
MGDEATRFARRRYDPAEAVRETFTIYARLAGSHAAAPPIGVAS